MALNKFMHPNNPFRKKQPNFKEFAKKYSFFAEICEQKDDNSPIEINFKEPRCQYALTKALLMEYFDLKFSHPLDRLIPTIPLRVNYLLWMEEILKPLNLGDTVRGFDIGSGASCVFPLLGVKMFKWKFAASELDPTNFVYAQENVKLNEMEDDIQVFKVSDTCLLTDALAKLESSQFDFVMSNPPFFSTRDEADGFTKTRDLSKRPLPMSASTASEVESVYNGGEVFFVSRIIHESRQHKDDIRIFSSMLGKKASLAPLKRLIRRLKIPSHGTYEFCQGKVMRWGIAWSFVPNIEFPESPFQLKRKQKRPPLHWIVPEEISCLDKYDRLHLCVKLKSIFKDLQIHCLEQKMKGDAEEKCLVITAFHNTWTHQRRRRRAKAQKMDFIVSDDEVKISSNSPNRDKEQLPSTSQADVPQKSEIRTNGSETVSGNISSTSSGITKRKAGADNIENSGEDVDSIDEPSSKHIKLSSDEAIVNSEIIDSDTIVEQKDIEQTQQKPENVNSMKDHILRSRVYIRMHDDLLVIEMEWISGSNRELMNQVFYYVKNNLK